MTFIELQNSPIEIESSPIQLESSVIESESFQFNKRALVMCTVREHADSFAAFCNWIRELSYSIKSSLIQVMLAILKNDALESSPIQLQSFLIHLRIS